VDREKFATVDNFLRSLEIALDQVGVQQSFGKMIVLRIARDGLLQ